MKHLDIIVAVALLILFIIGVNFFVLPGDDEPEEVDPYFSCQGIDDEVTQKIIRYSNLTMEQKSAFSKSQNDTVVVVRENIPRSRPDDFIRAGEYLRLLLERDIKRNDTVYNCSPQGTITRAELLNSSGSEGNN